MDKTIFANSENSTYEQITPSYYQYIRPTYKKLTSTADKLKRLRAHFFKVLGHKIQSPSLKSSSYQKNENNIADASLKTHIKKYFQNDITILDNQPIKVFNIGFSSPKAFDSQSFSEATKISKINFQLVDIENAQRDLGLFSLILNDQYFSFNNQGKLSISQNIRIARGESKNIKVELALNDSDNFSRLPFRFKLKIGDIVFGPESRPQQRRKKINITSPNISWNSSSLPTSNTPKIDISEASSIYGKSISAGEKAWVSSISLSAQYEDIILESLTLKNNIDNQATSLIEEVRLVDLSNKKVLDRKRFINQKVTFRLFGSNRVTIPRNTQKRIGFQIQLKNTIPKNLNDYRFEPILDLSETIITGYASGKPLNLTSQQVNQSKNIFTFHQANPSVGKQITSFNLTPLNLGATGSPEVVFYFPIKNEREQSLSIGRISIKFSLNSLALSTGTTSDFELRLLSRPPQENNIYLNNAQVFETTKVTGNSVHFDAPNRFIVPAKETLYLGVLASTKKTGNNPRLGARFLGDNSFAQGSLNALRSQGQNFIWSDTPLVSGNWFSGFGLNIFPSDFTINKY